MPVLKVASVIPSLASHTGGPALNLVDSVPHLRDQAVEVTIFTTDMDAPASSPAGRVGPLDLPAGADLCDIRMARARFPRRIAYAPHLRKLLAGNLAQFDVVRIHGVYLYPHMVAAQEARRAGVPYIITPHGALDPWIRRHGRARKALSQLVWQNRMFQHAAAVHTTTITERELVNDLVPRHVARFVVGNGVDVSAFSELPASGSLRRELKLPSDALVLLFVGRISRKKGIDILIKALPLLRPRPVTLIVAGPDDEGLRPTLERLARELGVEAQVFFVGPRFGPQRLEALADGDLWALTSHAENFGNAVLEAMASGVPTIVSTEVNLARELGHARAAAICRCDPADFAEQCARLLDDPDRLRQFATRGREFADRYDWPIIGAELREMFESVCRA